MFIVTGVPPAARHFLPLNLSSDDLICVLNLCAFHGCVPMSHSLELSILDFPASILLVNIHSSVMYKGSSSVLSVLPGYLIITQSIRQHILWGNLPQWPGCPLSLQWHSHHLTTLQCATAHNSPPSAFEADVFSSARPPVTPPWIRMSDRLGEQRGLLAANKLPHTPTME